ncbi:(deoxy)nucleoside triphosphate pyrophosphohydrolase [Actinomadura barringtoniae]|uniref:8-oxo-dGTP diphosphatase n=1 Tax=Actinomadura barringtoniae TaxID=1427535 RepID=A0A939PE55_9ACTN|nr:(deoxy)nucleoside triphosphate pyrophosphohydrolase [Actinomadura barringtoniae]MBO2446851.1 (deoxy)nucleoside triphosphate pyrophosphohydrolase [Actinomadura barringtoniae]
MTINVVVGAAIIRDGRLLAAQRAEPAELAGGWEFPGGKVDPGETDEDALVRECHEELGVKVALGERIGGDWPLSLSGVLRVWTAELVEGEPQALEHLALRWLEPGQLYDVEWLPGDLPLVEEIRPHLTA